MTGQVNLFFLLNSVPSHSLLLLLLFFFVRRVKKLRVCARAGWEPEKKKEKKTRPTEQVNIISIIVWMLNRDDKNRSHGSCAIWRICANYFIVKFAKRLKSKSLSRICWQLVAAVSPIFYCDFIKFKQRKERRQQQNSSLPSWSWIDLFDNCFLLLLWRWEFIVLPLNQLLWMSSNKDVYWFVFSFFFWKKRKEKRKTWRGSITRR